MDRMNRLTAPDHRQGEEGPPQRVLEDLDGWSCRVPRCRSGLHEPAKRTKICTNRARLALGCLSASSRPQS